MHQSGSHEHHGHITKRGSKMARFLLVECIHMHVHHCPGSNISRFYERKAKGSQITAVAAARKMAAVGFMLTKDEEFRGPSSWLNLRPADRERALRNDAGLDLWRMTP